MRQVLLIAKIFVSRDENLKPTVLSSVEQFAILQSRPTLFKS
jgi:hypothetical protein